MSSSLKICRTDPQCISVAVLRLMDPQCTIGGHDLFLWCHQFMIWVWECLPQNGYIWYSADAWMFAGLRLDVLLVLDTHMQLTKSIDCHWFHSQTLGGILLSTFLVIEMILWSCHDNGESNSSLRTFSWERLHLSSFQNHILKIVRRLLIYYPARILHSRRLHSAGVRTSHSVLMVRVRTCS